MSEEPNVQSGQRLYDQAKKLIPGGTQLLSKRPEMFLPDQWPSYYSKAEGPYIWDLDNHQYLDMSYNGVGACVLGYSDPDVNAAVHTAVANGSVSTLNCPEEVELAQLLVKLHPWSDMVRYARSGGEAMAVAVRIARAFTGRDKIAFCGYHGWHDWYLAANLSSDNSLDGHLLPGLSPAGVPRGLENTALPFHYNRIDELHEIIRNNPGEIAAIVMEPLRSTQPIPGFLEDVQQIAHESGAILVFDEITAGFRLTCGGAHLLYGVQPDIAVFAKAISNGFPMAAILGKSMVMESAQNSFISSTSWTDRVGPAAALATIQKHKREDVAQHLAEVGSKVREGWIATAAEAELRVHVNGIPPLPHLEFDYPNSKAIRTLFTQMMLERDCLAMDAFYATFAHRTHHIEEYLEKVTETFALLSQAIHSNTVESLIKGPTAHTGFQRLT